MRLGKPLPLRQVYWRSIQKEVERLFYEVVFKPLLAATESDPTVTNAVGDALYEAIREGRVWFEDGQFRGTFNAAVSKRLQESGATFNRRSGTWSYAGTLPADLSIAAATASLRYTYLRRAILTSLDNMNIESIDRLSNIPDKYQQTIEWMNDDFEKSVKGVTVAPQLTAGEVGMLSANWGMNLDLYVRNWCAEEILKLRRVVMEQTFEGRRAESIAKLIQREFGVAQRKAEFLARQETGLLMAEFHRQRYKSVGFNRYVWRGVMDARERADHKALEGQILSWDAPPVTDLRTGARNHPSQDFGCRCIAVPVIE